MSKTSQPDSDSILNLLNPYASVSRSAYPTTASRDRPDPDSPSALLLRQLQDGEDAESPTRHPFRRGEEGDVAEEEQVEGQRDGKGEATRLSRLIAQDGEQIQRGGEIKRPTYVLASPASSSDDEAPPRSIMFENETDQRRDVPKRRRLGSGQGQDQRHTAAPSSPPHMAEFGFDSVSGSGGVAGAGDRTPRSPSSRLPRTQPFVPPTSPGPFREILPSSSSASAASVSALNSRSNSPGPTTASAYASVSESMQPSAAYPQRPTSVGKSTTAGATGSGPGSNMRAYGLSDSGRGPLGRVPEPRSSSTAVTSGYLDPPLSSPKNPGLAQATSGISGKKKGKGKGKHRYIPVNNGEEVELIGENEERESVANGRYAGFGIRDGGGKGSGRGGLNEYEKALWKWVNVDDLDGFLQEVYAYYKGKGIYCIILARVLNLLTTFFVIGFSTFLMSCIDYTKLASSVSGPNSVGRLDDALIGQCLTRGSFPHMLFILSVVGVYIFQLFTFALSIPRLVEMYKFYTHLLGIPDADIQTLPWPEIVRLIGEIRKHNPVTSLSNGQANALAGMVDDDAKAITKLDAHDIANRILRQENYLIALFNKDLLDLHVRIPVPRTLVHVIPPNLLAPLQTTELPQTKAPGAGVRERRFIRFGANTLTKALEWNLRFCLMGYLFDRRGQVRKEFVRDKRRKDLVEGFIFMGVLNAIFAPFIVVYLLMYSFFRYFEEYHKNPSSIGGRQYTPYAQWKFREFNELPHLFERRLDQSYPIAKEYIDQFPKERTALIMRFVAFIAGSFAAVLLAASLIDPDLFLHFEITPHRTVLFYLGIFGSILAIARGMIPEENLVFDPEACLREVVRYTHYLPAEWKGKLHSQRVHAEFGKMFDLKVNVFFTELLSVILTPFILWFSLPPCSSAIIDFFREFSVHVDGVGYVCSFAVFDFKRHGVIPDPDETVHSASPENGGEARVRNTSAPRIASRNLRTNENKMEKSLLHFKVTHPDWQPSDPTSSILLDRLVGQLDIPSPHIQYYNRHGAVGGAGNGSGSNIGLSTQGGRGLGIGVASAAWAQPSALPHGTQQQQGVYSPHSNLEESRLREKSRSYDRAWAKSSAILTQRSSRRSIPVDILAAGHSGSSGEGVELGGGKRKDMPRSPRSPRIAIGSGQLETMREGEEEEEEIVGSESGNGIGIGGGGGVGVGGSGEAEALGWNRRVKGGEEEWEGADEILSDAGVIGILQQVLKR